MMVFDRLIRLHCTLCTHTKCRIQNLLTDTRASGSDDALKLTPPKILSLEQALDFIDTDELLEITPKSIRIRKKILDPTLRMRAKRAMQSN